MEHPEQDLIDAYRRLTENTPEPTDEDVRRCGAAGLVSFDERRKTWDGKLCWSLNIPEADRFAKRVGIG